MTKTLRLKRSRHRRRRVHRQFCHASPLASLATMKDQNDEWLELLRSRNICCRRPSSSKHCVFYRCREVGVWVRVGVLVPPLSLLSIPIVYKTKRMHA